MIVCEYREFWYIYCCSQQVLWKTFDYNVGDYIIVGKLYMFNLSLFLRLAQPLLMFWVYQLAPYKHWLHGPMVTCVCYLCIASTLYSILCMCDYVIYYHYMVSSQASCEFEITAIKRDV